MADNVMVDLETYDNKPTSVILSIGAIRIDHKNNRLVDPFYRTICIDSCRLAGLTESQSTKDWWAKQSDEAKRVFTEPTVPLIQALADFANYLRMIGQSRVKLWGNGSDFDNVIIANAYNALGLDAPWRFYNNRCFRTVKNVLKHKIPALPREGVYHNALADAEYQAKVLLTVRDDIDWG